MTIKDAVANVSKKNVDFEKFETFIAGIIANCGSTLLNADGRVEMEMDIREYSGVTYVHVAYISGREIEKANFPIKKATIEELLTKEGATLTPKLRATYIWSVKF